VVAPNYNWTCNACGETVKAGESRCSKCGCKAGANGIETEKKGNPLGYLRKLAYRKFEAAILAVIYAPFFILALYNAGRFPELFIVVIGLVVFFIKDWKSIQHAFQDRAYLASCLSVGIVVFFAMVGRIYFIPDFIVNYAVLGLVVMCCVTYYLLKGKKAQEACKRFNDNQV